MITNIPLSIYIHFPWCIKKCPYCDFNSFQADLPLAADRYFEQLCCDLEMDLVLARQQKVRSIFMGGGTPSLFSAQFLEKILNHLAKHFSLDDKVEITLEANPGTIDLIKCKDFLRAGFNRISVGVQSFQDEKLKVLQRIHTSNGARAALDAVIASGFTNFNIDLMFALPGQKVRDAIADLNNALSYNPPHISWYQLTIEPNTAYFLNPPSNLPNDDLIWKMQQEGQKLMSTRGLVQYEISAYAKASFQCRHNVNYWKFGDYLGIGAGAHGKITNAEGVVHRLAKIADPKMYLSAQNDFVAEEKIVTKAELFFEFMLNALRLNRPIPFALFKERTMLEFQEFLPKLKIAENAGLLHVAADYVETTLKGKLFLNELLEMLLPK